MQKKIAMIEENENFFDEIFELFVVSKTANGVSDATLRNYHYHRKAVSKYLDTNRPISEITKRDLERMIVDMKKDGIKHNSIATYVRFLRTLFNWCEAEEIAVPKLKNLKEKEVVKETYTDAELEKLLRMPKKGCAFGEYRTWVIINFLLNSGCSGTFARRVKEKRCEFLLTRGSSSKKETLFRVSLFCLWCMRGCSRTVKLRSVSYPG